MPTYRLLIVDDEPRMCQVLRLAAQQWGYEARTAGNGIEALKLLEEFQPELVVSDIRMPGMDGETLLKRLREQIPEAQVILMTAYGSVRGAVDAMKAGAFDYILKPFDNEELRVGLSRASEFLRLKVDNAHLRRQLSQRYSADMVVGQSHALQKVMELVERVGPSRATALITGESGTGKELVARTLHFRSPRAGEAFVAVNCAALTETLLESELFGHERGAFTGATRTHRGKFEMADRGTIFLDEIGDVSLSFQSKLLRVLQEGTFERVGSTHSSKVDVRVIAATNRNLKELVDRGQFREDLFYRLNVVPVHLPPLRDRRSDVPDLARHFLRKCAHETGAAPKVLTDDAIEALMRAEWRGNVRELENTIERAVILSRSQEITEDDLWLMPSESLPGEGRDYQAQSGPVAAQSSLKLEPELLAIPLSDFVDVMTKRRIIAALDSTGWRKQEAADALGVDRATLYRMIRRYGMEPN